MKTDVAVDAYLEAAPEARQDGLRSLRAACMEELDGFSETMAYGMPSYERNGEVEVSFANQKQYLSLYVRTDVVEAHRAQLGRLDVGKSCIRYRKPSDIDLDVVSSMLRATAAATTTGPVW